MTAAGLVAALGSAFICLLVLASVGPAIIASWPWLGDGGIAGFVVSVGTLGAALYAGRHAWAAHRLSERADLATRYQKAAELLASPTASTSISGLYVMREIASEAPEQYLIPIVDVIIAFIEERCANAAWGFHGRANEHWIDPDTGDPVYTDEERAAFRKVPWWDTAPAVNHALKVIGELRSQGPVLEVEQKQKGGRAWVIKEMILNHAEFLNGNFSGMEFLRCMFNEVTFVGCDLSGVKIDAANRYNVTYADCDLTDAELEDREPVMQHESRVRFNESVLNSTKIRFFHSTATVNNCEVNGQTLLRAGDIKFRQVFSWKDAPKIPREPGRGLHIYVVDRRGSFDAPTKRGFMKYAPFDGQAPDMIDP